MHPYVQILKDELSAAMGCTEPIAIAYAAALARETLGADPECVKLAVSKNIIKKITSPPYFYYKILAWLRYSSYLCVQNSYEEDM